MFKDGVIADIKEENKFTNGPQVPNSQAQQAKP